jgi:pimeloyl-ACP methyl ester carboxylesterase
VRVRYERIVGDGVRLHVARAGEGTPVVLLHRFPEHGWPWRKQLAAAGFSGRAADPRGCDRSDRLAARSAPYLRRLVSFVRF